MCLKPRGKHLENLRMEREFFSKTNSPPLLFAWSVAADCFFDPNIHPSTSTVHIQYVSSELNIFFKALLWAWTSPTHSAESCTRNGKGMRLGRFLGSHKNTNMWTVVPFFLWRVGFCLFSPALWTALDMVVCFGWSPCFYIKGDVLMGCNWSEHSVLTVFWRRGYFTTLVKIVKCPLKLMFWG